MKPKQLREKSASELAKQLVESREELFHLTLKKSTGQLDKPHRLSELKRGVARILTLQREASQKKVGE